MQLLYFVPWNDAYEPPKPVYEHDCDRCAYLGAAHFREENSSIMVADVYVCNDTVIVRYSSAGSDYYSGSLSDYMSILIRATPYTSVLRAIITELYDKGLLIFNPTFITQGSL